MKKLGFVLGATCAMVIAAGSLTASQLAKQPERDARIIVEVNRKLESLKKEDVRKTQDIVYNNIKQTATSNARLIQRYNKLIVTTLKKSKKCQVSLVLQSIKCTGNAFITMMAM